MTRLPDWQRRLIDVVEASADTPFRWGTHDCILFGGRCVAAVTGEDPVADVIGTYAAPEEAAALLRERGYTGLEDMLTFHFERVPPAMARRGDLGIAIPAAGGGLAVCLGDRFAGPAEPRGLMRLPAASIASAFRVG